MEKMERKNTRAYAKTGGAHPRPRMNEKERDFDLVKMVRLIGPERQHPMYNVGF